MLDFDSQVLDHVRVGDCMHHGLVTCDPQTPLPEVAAAMTAHRVHAVALVDPAGHTSGVVSDTDLIAAAACSDAFHAKDAAAAEAPSVAGDWPLRHAVRLMAEHGLSHLIVRDPANGHPIGVLSAGDVISAYALTSRPAAE
jgi:CBS domain-containing protein